MALKVEENLSTSNQTTTKSKKRRKAAETLVHFVLDETGSMNPVRDATIDGFNEYVNGLRSDKKGKYWLSLTKFDSRGIVPVYTDLPIKEVPDLNHDTYCPCSMTNLNDAIGETVTKMESIVANRRKRCNVLIVVMTDGHENASVEWTADRVKDLIKKKEKSGWTVTFLGANMDAQKVGSTYAIRAGNTKSYSTQNMAKSMRGLSGATVKYAASASVGSATTDFFEGTSDWTDENDKSMKTVGDSSVNLPGTAPVDSSGVTIIQTTMFDPKLTQNGSGFVDPKLPNEANERFRKYGKGIKPSKEDTDNG